MNEVPKEDTKEDKNSNYVITIDNFEGPLDLLWDLIKRAKIDITEILISKITEQYIEYLKLMENLNVKVASEFVLMASNLLYYKSKALLPGEEMEDEYFYPPLPADLVQKLLEYKKYQLTSIKLKDYFEIQSDLFTRKNVVEEPEESGEFAGISLFDLLDTFAQILNSTDSIESEEIVFDEILISDMIKQITFLLKEKGEIFFSEIFSIRPGRAEIVASLLAILEMAKYKKVRLLQHRIFGDIKLMSA